MKKSQYRSGVIIIVVSLLAFFLGCASLKYFSVNPGIRTFEPMEKVIVLKLFISTYSNRYIDDLETIGNCCIERFGQKGRFAMTGPEEAFSLLKDKGLEEGYEKFISKLLIFKIVDRAYLEEVASALHFDGMLVVVLTMKRVFGVRDNDVELGLYLIDLRKREIAWKASSTIVIGEDLNLEPTENNNESDLERLISIVDKLPRRLRLKRKR